MTQQDLATLVGLTRTSITNIEKGRQPIPIHTLAEIARHIKTDVPGLLPPTSLLKQKISDRLIKFSEDERSWITMVLNAKETKHEGKIPTGPAKSR